MALDDTELQAKVTWIKLAESLMQHCITDGPEALLTGNDAREIEDV
jgi:hypothetical protein